MIIFIQEVTINIVIFSVCTAIASNTIHEPSDCLPTHQEPTVLTVSASNVVSALSA